MITSSSRAVVGEKGRAYADGSSSSWSSRTWRLDKATVTIRFSAQLPAHGIAEGCT